MAQVPVPVGEVSELLPLKPHPLQYTVLEDKVTNCSVTQDGSVLLLSCGPRLLSYSARNGRLCNIWRFGREAPREPRVGPWVFLTHAERYYAVAAVDGDGVSPDLLCVCHVLTSKVIKAVRMPSPVTSICVVDDGSSSDALAGSPAAFTSGCIAVATKEAQVFLVDLCMNHERYSSEEFPASLKFVDGASPVGSTHGAVFVCDQESLYESVTGAHRVPGNADVTCLEYFPQLGCLGIGLSDGTVYLWRILTGSFMLSMKASELAVVGLMLQEPENDPRRWCYLWVINGAKRKKGCNDVTSCAMFSLDFTKKSPLDNYRFFYEGFNSYHQVFECALGPYLASLGHRTAGLPGICSRLVSCRTMLQAEVFHSRGNLDVSDPCHTVDRQHDLNLMLLSWELLQDGQLLGTYLTIFDMNQWYHAQMPPVARPGQFASYLGVFSLKAVPSEHGLHSVMDVYVVPRSITKFSSWGTSADQTRFPSSLLFKCVCVTDGGVVHVTFRGLQRQLLHNLSRWGPDCLLSPKELYVECCCLGLLSQELSGALLDTFVPSMRKAILSMAMDNRLLGFLMSCIDHWADPDSQGASEAGLKLTFFIEWAWDRVKENKASVDRLCVPLFDCLGREMSLASLQRLGFIGRDMKVLLKLFKHCSTLRPADVDLESLTLREEVVERVGQYISVVMFLMSCGLLPEGDEGSSDVSYPATFLKQWYQQARKTSTLVIDALMEAMFRGSASPWGEPYPAPTLQEALTGAFLMHSLPSWGPHGLLLYLLLDLASVLLESHPQVAEALKEFPFLFSLSPSLESLVQGCWHLDHSLYDKGLDLLLEAWGATGLSHLKDALSRPILRLLSENGKPRHALRFLDFAHFPAPHKDPELLSLHLDVLLADQRVMEALHLVRESRDPSAVEELFERIITASKPEPGEGSLFRQLVEQQLSSAEECALEDRLRRGGELKELGRLAFHWLREGRTRDAVRVAATLRELLQRSGTGLQPSGGRNPMLMAVLALVEGVAALLPTLPPPSSIVRQPAIQVVRLPTPVQVLPRKAGTRNVGGFSPALQFAVETSRVPRKTHLTPFRQDVVYPRYEQTPAAGSPYRSWDDSGEPPSKMSRMMDGSSRRRWSGVSPLLLEEALSVLRTPPVKRGGPLGGSVIVPHTPPPSILKLRFAVTSRESAGSIADASPPPTPLLLAEASSTPDAATRKLRFAIMDSSPSEVSFPMTDMDRSRLTDLDASVAPSECNRSTDEAVGHPQSTLSGDEADNSGQASFMTADEGSSDDENVGTKLENDRVQPRPPLSEIPAGKEMGIPVARSAAGFPGAISLPSRALALRGWSPGLQDDSEVSGCEAEFSPNKTDERHPSKENVDSSPEVICEKVVLAAYGSEGAASEVETVVISSSSSEKSVPDADLAHQHEQHFAVKSTAAKGNGTPLAELGTPTSWDVRRHDPDLARAQHDEDSVTPLAEAVTAAAVPETPLGVDVPPMSAVPEYFTDQGREASSDDKSSEGTPLKDSERAEIREQQPCGREDAEAADEAPAFDPAFQYKGVATALPRRLFPSPVGSEQSDSTGVEDNATPLVPACPDGGASDHPEVTDLADENLAVGTVPLHDADNGATSETKIDGRQQRGEEAAEELWSSDHRVVTVVVEGSELLPDVEGCKVSERNVAEEAKNEETALTRLRARRPSEASDDSASGQALMFYEMAAASESSVSLPGSEPDEMQESKQEESPERAGSGMATRLRSTPSSLPATASSPPEKLDTEWTSKSAGRSASSLGSGRDETEENSAKVWPRTRRRSGSWIAAEDPQQIGEEGSARTDGLRAWKSQRRLLSPYRKLPTEKAATGVIAATFALSESLACTPSEPEVEGPAGSVVAEMPGLERQGQKGRQTPKKNARARSETPPDVRTIVTRRRSGVALQAAADQTPERTPGKTSETPQSSRKRKQSPDGTIIMELRSRSALELRTSTREGKATPRKTPVGEKEELPPAKPSPSVKGRRTSTPVSPSRRSTRVTPNKPGSPMPTTGVQRGTSSEDDVKRHAKRLHLDTIPEDELIEDVEMVSPASSSAGTPSGSPSSGRAQRRPSSRTEARRRSLRLMETIPEGEAGGSGEEGSTSGLERTSAAEGTAGAPSTKTTEEQPSRPLQRGSRSPEASSRKEHTGRSSKKDTTGETPKKRSPKREPSAEESQKKASPKKEPPKVKSAKRVTPQKESHRPEPRKEESPRGGSPRKSPKKESAKKKSKETSRKETSKAESAKKEIPKVDPVGKGSPKKSAKRGPPTKQASSEEPLEELSKTEPSKAASHRKEAPKVEPLRKESSKEPLGKDLPKKASSKKTPKKDSSTPRKKQALSEEPPEELSKTEPSKAPSHKKEAPKVEPLRKESSKEPPSKDLPKKASPKKTPKKDSSTKEPRKKQAPSKEPLKKELPKEEPPNKASPTSEKEHNKKSISPRKESPIETSPHKEHSKDQEGQQTVPENVAAETTATPTRREKVTGTKEATPVTKGRSLKRKRQRAEQGDAVIPPEAKESVFSPPVTRHQRSLLQESDTSVVSKEPPSAELSMSPPFQAPSVPSSRRSSLGARKKGTARPLRQRSSTSTISAKLVNRSKLSRSVRLPSTPRSSSSSSSSQGSPGSPWTIVNPKGGR